VVFSPRRDLAEDRHQGVARGRQFVAHGNRRALEHGSAHQTGFDQRGQPLEEAGRDPGTLDMILRIYPTVRTDSVVADVADTIKRVADQTEVRHVLVDLMYQADDVDELLARVAGILAAAQ
jgi:hypothetical protein